MMQSGETTSDDPVPRFDIWKLYQKAKFEWLKASEIMIILENYEENLISREPPNRPPGGTLFLFNRRVLRFFRKDGHAWQRKKDGRTIGEAHEQLKINNVPVLSCYYARGEENPLFQRRTYWMLDPGYEHIVLVHYRDLSEGRYSESSSSPEIISSISGDGISHQKFYDLCSLRRLNPPDNASGFIEKSPREIESPDNASDSGLSDGRGISREPSQAQIHETFRNLEQQLIFDDDDIAEWISDEQALDQHPTIDPLISGYFDDVSVPPCLTSSPSLDTSNVVHSSLHGPAEDIRNHGGQNDDPEIFEKIEAGMVHFFWDGESDNGVPPNDDATSFYSHPKQLFSIKEISPEWAFSSDKNTKVLIIGDFLLSGYSEFNWKVMFGDVQVPAEIVMDGVIRCRPPAHVPGKVNVWLTSGNGESCSEMREFEYLEKPETSDSETRGEFASAGKSNEELLLLTRLTQTLLSRHGATSSACDDQWEHVIESLSCGRGDASGVVDWLLEELLKNKLFLRLRPITETGAGTESLLSREEKQIVHMVSGLGFLWALNPVLEAGVGVNFRDSNGWTALHWAAHFGREEMVSALIAAGASARAVTDPTALEPNGNTPASIADASGHKGLAGYLSEIALKHHLSSLTLQESEISKGSVELEREIAVERLAAANQWLHESATTWDQTSLQLSLAAARGASQAAARIQAAFRAASFRRKRETADQQALEECFSAPADIFEYPLAATFIQKKFRGWVKRRRFLLLRKHAQRIQAYVRGYQARKRYKEMTSMVGVFEKAVLRWHRRGSGLRGFRVASAPIEEEDDEDIRKVFRRENVTPALEVAVSRVFSLVESPEARRQYCRLVESYWLTKMEFEIGATSSDRRPDG